MKKSPGKKLSANKGPVMADVDLHLEELKSRSKSLADGTAKSYSWEETKNVAIKKVKDKKK